MRQSKYTRARLKFIDTAEEQLAGGVKKMQTELWDRVESVINKLKTDEGKIDGGAANYSLLGQLNAIATKMRNGPKKEIISSLIKNLLDQEDLVKTYFNKFLSLERSAVEDRVHKKLLNRIGYDGEGFVDRGVLHDLWTDDADIRAIRAQTVKAIAGGQSWQEFQTQMKVLVQGDGEKLGVTEAHFKTVTMDMYAQNDRALTKQYADEYELDKFIFQGGLMNNTRDFCRARNNRIFTRKEIEEWSGLSWQGKPKVYDPFLDVGGHRCRHVLDPVSDELAEELLREEGESSQSAETPIQDITRFGAAKLNKRLEKYVTDLDSDFLEKMPSVTLSIRNRDARAYYMPEDETVHIFNKPTDYTKRRVIYHEFGHAYHFKSGLITRDFVHDDIKKDFDNLKEILLSSKEDLDKFTTEALIKARVDLNIRLEDYKDVDLYNKRFQEVSNGRDDIGGTLDTIEALTKGKHGKGHGWSYFNSKKTANSEFWEVFAHATEIRYNGNEFMKSELPDLYKAMIDFAKKYIK